MTAPALIAFASKIAPTYTGGLAAYQRSLIAAIANLGHTPCSLYENERFPDSRLGYEAMPWTSHRLRRTVSGYLGRNILPTLSTRTPQIAAFLAERRLNIPDTMRPSAIHITGTGWDHTGFAMAKWARELDVPFSIWPAVHPGQWGDSPIDMLLYGLADVVFCQSSGERDDLIKLGLDPQKTRLCGLPPFCRPDGQGDRLRKHLEIEDRPVVLFLGRRDKGKGYPALIEAWRIVLERQSEAVLMLAGPGNALRPGQLPENSYRDLGLLDEKTKADAYAACDIFCLPSAHESFGIVFVEAWSYGKPVVCGPAPASRELIEDGETGLWSTQDPAVLADKLITLLESPTLAKTMGNAGKQLQQESYTTERMVRSHLQAWQLVA